ncbi:hypothetical protein MSHOH_3195 [Methanosarcina horonobensis HB-1 = JCM 15518]|uniref:ABC transporter, permease protein n=2 Tax=Methanosarcina horonobensis TaxID=418008 RepID=A0A0E3SIC1_9EURY|nr:hypothetical protein MSHOH_3195 [Methanosarcina horonobensis HB-1 = JCM 15518]
MDERRVPTILTDQKKTRSGNFFKSSLITYGILGFFIGLLMLVPFPLFYKMNLAFGIIIFMVMATMISDFSTVLLDVKDKNILLPRPVDARTINTAKLLHIVIYLFTITMSISGLALLAGLFKYGVAFALIFMFELVLICCLVVFFTSILYMAVLSFFDGEKLKDMINYIQILLSVFMLVGYQFMGRIFNLTRLTVTFHPAWWHFLIPTTWFAAPFSLFIERNSSQYFTALSLLALIVPTAATVLYMTLVIPYFEGKLQKLNSSSMRANKGAAIREKIQRAAANLLCFSRTEKAFYQFTQNMLSNERKLKLQLYPQLAFAMVMPFLMLPGIIRGGVSWSDILVDLANSKLYLAVYWSAIFLAFTATMISSSENYSGAWIYRALPIESPVPLLKGSLKAFIVKFVIPIYLLIALIFVLLCGLKIIPDLILIFINMIMVLLFIFKLNRKELPFYRDFQVTQGMNRVGIMLTSMLVCGLCALVHLLLTYVPSGVILNIVLSLVIVMVLWRKSFNITWKEIIKDAI